MYTRQFTLEEKQSNSTIHIPKETILTFLKPFDSTTSRFFWRKKTELTVTQLKKLIKQSKTHFSKDEVSECIEPRYRDLFNNPITRPNNPSPIQKLVADIGSCLEEKYLSVTDIGSGLEEKSLSLEDAPHIFQKMPLKRRECCGLYF